MPLQLWEAEPVMNSMQCACPLLYVQTYALNDAKGLDTHKVKYNSNAHVKSLLDRMWHSFAKGEQL